MSVLNYQPPSSPLDIIYQDRLLLVLNKPSGLLSVPGRLPQHRDSLQLRVQQQFPTALTVHRLDMETSGIIIMALNKEVQRDLNRQFAERRVEKIYIARVYGKVIETQASSQGIIDQPLICDWDHRPKQKIDHKTGKPSQTHWQIIANEPKTTLLKLKPITGRSHQLRVHLAHLKHPILGDQLYAHPTARKLSSRLQLHSQSLTINHPQTQKPQQFHCPVSFWLVFIVVSDYDVLF